MAQSAFPNTNTEPRQPEEADRVFTPARPRLVDPTAPPPEVAARALPPSQPAVEAGEAIGSALGGAVRMTRNLPGKLQEIRSRVKFRALLLRRRARWQAEQKADEWKESGADLAAEARRRAHHWALAYPFQTLGAAAATGFLLGFVLRLWRDNG